MSAILPIGMVEKPWGVVQLPAPFAAEVGKRIGEIWFEPPAALDRLLVKYIFTSEKLSVQVHPSDTDAPAGHGGKEECWLVIAAEPGARLGIGFREAISAAAIRAAALDGSIEQLLVWHEVRQGDFFYIPAGTVHAIGGGISLIEIQQNADITYRLYDYGRPRELHLDEAVAIATGAPHDAALRCSLPERGTRMLADGPHFRLARIDGAVEQHTVLNDRPLLAIPLQGFLAVGGEKVAPGQVAIAHDTAEVDGDAGSTWLLAQSLDGTGRDCS